MMGQFGDSWRLRVSGDLALDAQDQVMVRAYMAELRRGGMSEVAAEAAAYEQIAQDLLGRQGFMVEEVEPL